MRRLFIKWKQNSYILANDVTVKNSVFNKKIPQSKSIKRKRKPFSTNICHIYVATWNGLKLTATHDTYLVSQTRLSVDYSESSKTIHLFSCYFIWKFNCIFMFVDIGLRVWWIHKSEWRQYHQCFSQCFCSSYATPKKKKNFNRKWFLVTVRKVGRCVTVHAVDRGKKRNDPFALCYDCGYSFARIKWFYPIVVLVANKNEKKI